MEGPPMKRTKAVDLEALPGHYIRRLQQIAVAVFLQETEAHGVTPVQYAALNQVARTPDIDQRSLARAIGFDTSTIASVIDRLEARGLMQRRSSPDDKRVRLLGLTAAGAELVEAIGPDILKAQERMLHPLTKTERAEFMRLLKAVVSANNELSRAPSDG
jgi:DNA-binding MarR family transcriptional regulator